MYIIYIARVPLEELYYRLWDGGVCMPPSSCYLLYLDTDCYSGHARWLPAYQQSASDHVTAGTSMQLCGGHTFTSRG